MEKNIFSGMATDSDSVILEELMEVNGNSLVKPEIEFAFETWVSTVLRVYIPT